MNLKSLAVLAISTFVSLSAWAAPIDQKTLIGTWTASNPSVYSQGNYSVKGIQIEITPWTFQLGTFGDIQDTNMGNNKGDIYVEITDFLNVDGARLKLKDQNTNVFEVMVQKPDSIRLIMNGIMIDFTRITKEQYDAQTQQWLMNPANLPMQINFTDF